MVDNDEKLSLLNSGKKLRIGRTVGRTIYIQLHEEYSAKGDILIGVMDSPEVAQRLVEAYNASVRWRNGE